MALQPSGAISLSDVNVELGNSSTAQINMGGTSVRTLFGVASGQIKMSDGYGKANDFTLTISSDATDVDIATAATAAGWNGSVYLMVVINSGIYVSATSTASPAMTISGSFPNGLKVTNNGYIVGKGGAGGAGGDATNFSASYGSAGSAGGKALSVSSSVTFDNTSGVIAGGGGGGGGSAGSYDQINNLYSYGGDGGGGGRSSKSSSAGGAAGTGTTSNGAAGNPGTFSSAGTSFAGNGGDWGSAGVSVVGAAGGAAGACLTGNSNITWIATGTRYGSVS